MDTVKFRVIVGVKYRPQFGLRMCSRALVVIAVRDNHGAANPKSLGETETAR